MDYEPKGEPAANRPDDPLPLDDFYGYPPLHHERRGQTASVIIATLTLGALLGLMVYSYVSYHTERTPRVAMTQADSRQAAVEDRTEEQVPEETPPVIQEEEPAQPPATQPPAAQPVVPAVPTPQTPVISGTAGALGETMRLSVIAREDKLTPIRIKVDDDLRRPYWVEHGESVEFDVRNTVILEDYLDRIEVRIAGVTWPTDRRDQEGRLVITRENVQSVLQGRR